MDRNITETNHLKNTLTLLAVMVMLMATLLTACGSSEAAAPSNEAETTKVETAQAEETEPAAPAEVEEVAEVEPTAEPTPEPVVYEGIDMESTLPGAEWMDTFDGIINEPKIVIFNDETNKKMIVENGQEVEFTDADTLSIYMPKGMELYVNPEHVDGVIFNSFTGVGNYTLRKGLCTIVNDGDIMPLEYKISGDGSYTLTVTLIAKRSE